MQNTFLITAMGRSGTVFLSSILNETEAKVTHERFPDIIFYQLAYRDRMLADMYFSLYRKHLINFDMKKGKYGEVNGLLRRHVDSFRKNYPEAPVIQLVRDPRNVVRSMMARKTFKYYDIGTKFVMPGKTDKYRDIWHHMNRFEQLCWYWTVDNIYLREHCDFYVTFEQIVSNYRYFKQMILDRINLNLTEEKWQAIVTKPKNVTKKHAIPKWEKWPPEMKKSFSAICSEEMKHYGYSLN